MKGQITGAKGDVVDAGRMGKLTIGDDGTLVMGELQTYDKTNVQAAADLITRRSRSNRTRWRHMSGATASSLLGRAS